MIVPRSMIAVAVVTPFQCSAQVVSYEGTSFPDDEPWERRDTLFIADGWLRTAARPEGRHEALASLRCYMTRFFSRESLPVCYNRWTSLQHAEARWTRE